MQLPVIDCIHSSAPTAEGSSCGLGLHGGRPHRGACRRCTARTPWPEGTGLPITVDPVDPWTSLHLWAATADLARVSEGLDAFQAALPTDGFNRRVQFAALRTRNPLPAHPSRLELCRWCYERHAAAPHRSGRRSPSYADAARQYGWPSETLIAPDRIVCLSLDSRPDRWEAFTASCRTSKLLSSWKIERYRATLPGEMIVPDWWTEKWPASHYATRVDHLRIMEQSYAAGHQSVLIFEDDAIVQGSFDEAYTTACESLPAGWMGLWLTSDGRVADTIDVGAGLVRSTGQYFLHAYLLSRAGMFRAYNDILKRPWDIIDQVTRDTHRDSPHFYSTKLNAVIQIGDRSRDEPRTEFFSRQPKNVIVPPFHGEFGWQLVRHVRYVHELQADAKVVCCRRGEECLYPSATSYEYGWTEAGPDASRCGNGPAGVAPARSGLTAVVPQYSPDGPWKKFRPRVTPSLPAVDVVLGVRRRDFERERNWQHWPWLAEQLRAAGLTVGLAGRADTSFGVPADAVTWDHPDGATAGSVDLLTRCKLYVGTDSGVSHLAAMCDAPMVLFRCPQVHSPDMTGLMAAISGAGCARLQDDAWDNSGAVLEAILRGAPRRQTAA